MFAIAAVVFAVVLGFLIVSFFRARRTLTTPDASHARPGLAYFHPHRRGLGARAGAKYGDGAEHLLGKCGGGRRRNAAVHGRNHRPPLVVGDLLSRPGHHDGQRTAHPGGRAGQAQTHLGGRDSQFLGATTERQARPHSGSNQRADFTGGRTRYLPGAVRRILRLAARAHGLYGDGRPRPILSTLGSPTSNRCRRSRPTRTWSRGGRFFRGRPACTVTRFGARTPRARSAPTSRTWPARSTLGAGTLTNSHGNLSGWIVNSQALKPGNKMPPMYLEPDALQGPDRLSGNA